MATAWAIRGAKSSVENGTWEWVEEELTLVTVPGAGPWVQQDAAELVSRTMVNWPGK